MDARLTRTQYVALRTLQAALHDADWIATSTNRPDGSAYRVKLDDRTPLRFLADALDTALDADSIGMTSAKPDEAERATTAIGRQSLLGFLDKAEEHHRGDLSLTATGQGDSPPLTTYSTTTLLRSVLIDAHYWNRDGATCPCDHDAPPELPPTAMTTSDQLRHALIDHLDAGTPADATVYIAPTDHPLDNGLTIPLGTLVDALADAAGDVHLRPTTKPRDTGQAADPDPYGIDLRGPHGPIHGADRAHLADITDLDPRTRAIFEQLLRLTLTNLDRQAPTQTGGNW